MELNIEEQKLLADFRQLSPAGKKELLDYAVFLRKKWGGRSLEADPEPTGQCKLQREEERPEASEEPIFTE